MNDINKELLNYFNGDELAANVWTSKYAAKGEKTPDDMHKRMAKEFARIELKNSKNITDNEYYNLSKFGQLFPKHLDFNDVYELLKNYKHIVFQGSIAATLGTSQIASLSNCWVANSPTDSYGGIHKTDGELIYFYKRRGGVGTNVDTLRPDGSFTNNAANSSTGAVSFMPRFSNTTREVAMNGRRGALMLMMFINHPDIIKFINSKKDLTQITGANISVKIFDGFMQALIDKKDYKLQFPCESNEPSIIKYENAQLIWDELINAAWTSAEPGVIFWDNAMNYDPATIYKEFKAIATNPCGEQFLQALDSCRLVFLNLFSFVKNPFTKDSEIDFDKLYAIAYQQMRLGDDLVDLEIEYIDRIINKINSDPEPENVKRAELELWIAAKETVGKGRRVGCGINSLGDMLAALNLKYDSDEALALVDKVMYTKMKAELDCSIDLSIIRGSFEGWNPVKEKETDNKFYRFIESEFPDQWDRMQRYGRRSVNWSTIAPTGSKSTQTQTTSGCEPLFLPYYIRRKKINPNEEGVRIDFTDQNGDTWQEFPVLHPKFKDWISTTTDYTEQVEAGIISSVEELNKATIQSLFEQSPWYGSTANDIDWIKRVEMQGILQKYTSNAISSTINLPETVTKEEVSEIYMASWKAGLKGQTIYRDNCRTGVLISENNKSKTDFDYSSAVKRPKCLPCDIHTTRSKGEKWNVIVGLLNDKPYEVFAIPHFTNETKMELCKMNKGRYDLQIKGETYSEDMTSGMNDEEEVITRLASMSLRHGASIAFLKDQLDKSNGDITSFAKAIGRTLKRYITNDVPQSISLCPNCNENTMIYEEGCKSCKSCGFSAC
jgi:ribonucleoside-diphosphate reductase alpha chain